MASLIELRQNRAAEVAKMDGLVTNAESGNRALSDTELIDFNAAKTAVTTLDARIKPIEEANTLRAQAVNGMVLPGTPKSAIKMPNRFSAEYTDAVAAYLGSGGKEQSTALLEGADPVGGGFKFAVPRASAALYESAPTAGGLAVPSQVSGEFVPLAPPELGVYSLVNVVPTTMDTRYTRKDSNGTAAAKAESGANLNSFGGTDPTIGQFTLSAYMMGHYEDASWELLQDVAQFQSFMTDDELLSLAVLREQWIINGSGIGQAQGMIGNVGAGVAGVSPDSSGHLVTVDDLEALEGSVNAVYLSGASYLMQRATMIGIRAAQRASNLFDPVVTRSAGQWYVNGFPVVFSSAMPAAAAGATPVLFGNFKAGYIFGERGGAGVNVKILDQPKALQGLLTVLAYQRVDGRVRRAEAIQGLTLHS